MFNVWARENTKFILYFFYNFRQNFQTKKELQKKLFFFVVVENINFPTKKKQKFALKTADWKAAVLWLSIWKAHKVKF